MSLALLLLFLGAKLADSCSLSSTSISEGLQFLVFSRWLEPTGPNFRLHLLTALPTTYLFDCCRFPQPFDENTTRIFRIDLFDR